MFGKIYLGELKKIVRPKAMIILSAVLILLLVGYAIIANLTANVTEVVTSEDEMGELAAFIPGLSGEYELSEDTIDAEIAMHENNLKEYEDQYKNEKGGYGVYSAMFGEKATLTALRYARDNKLYGEGVRFLGVNYIIGGIGKTTSDGFASDYMSVVASVISIYAIVIGAGLLADEYKNGTIKLLLTRPITKNQLITAKLLAALTVSLGIASVFSLIGFLYGVIAFSSDATTGIYLVFNGTNVIRSTVGAYLFGVFFISLMKCAVMCLIAYFLGTLTKKKTTGIIVGIIIYLGIISGILGLLPVQIGLLIPNMTLMNYFVPGATVPTYGNFFISLVVYLAYVAAVTFGLYYSVNKRDVI